MHPSLAGSTACVLGDGVMTLKHKHLKGFEESGDVLSTVKASRKGLLFWREGFNGSVCYLITLKQHRMLGYSRTGEESRILTSDRISMAVDGYRGLVHSD